MKETWKSELPLLLLIAAMLAGATLSWPSAPEQIPVHWGLHGEVNGYGGKFEGLLLMPLLSVGLYLLMRFLPRLDPGRLNYERFAGAYYTIRASTIAFLAVMYGVTQLAMRGVAVDMSRTIGLVMGAMFFVIGNVLGKIRPNWFVGIRTPWTLSSKISWSRTHRVAGWVFVAGGIALMVAGLVGTPAAMLTAVGFMVVGSLSVVAYSYVVWRGDPDRLPPAGTLPSNGDA